MAEVVGLTSGLLTLAIFAFQSSITLTETIQSFQSHPKRVRDLTDELEALSGVLGPLSETIRASPDPRLSSLDIPLLRCGHACEEFQAELLKCSSRSGNSRTSFRDWAKLRYMGGDIDSFRRHLAGYKLTITIALTDATLRKSTVTAENLESYRTLIGAATEDLQAHLEAINEKLEVVLERTETDPSSDSGAVDQIKDEITSTQRCLQICDRLSEHISQIQIPRRPSDDSSGQADVEDIPESVMNKGLQECRDSLLSTSAKLERHMKDLMQRMLAKSSGMVASQDDLADLARLQEEWETTRQCMKICAKADGHLNENVSVIDNYATGDAIQFMVSTDGKTIHGKNRGIGWRTRQVGGHLSDAAVIQLSQDMSRINVHGVGKDSNSSQVNPETDKVPDTVSDTAPDSVLDSVPGNWKRHGPGVRLQAKPDPTANPPMSDSASTVPDTKER